jgi:hypothetical protein
MGALIVTAMLSGGCDSLVRQSVLGGVSYFLYGGVSRGLDASGVSGLLGDLITGGIFSTGTTIGGRSNTST